MKRADIFAQEASKRLYISYLFYNHSKMIATTTNTYVQIYAFALCGRSLPHTTDNIHTYGCVCVYLGVCGIKDA